MGCRGGFLLYRHCMLFCSCDVCVLMNVIRVTFLNEISHPKPPPPETSPSATTSKKKKQKSHKKPTDLYPSLSPEPLYDALYRSKRFDYTKKGRQEDAEEFCGFLLEELERELLQLSSGSANASDDRGVGNTQTEDETWMEVGPKKKTLLTRKVLHPLLIVKCE